MARYRAEGEAAFEPRSRRPHDLTDRDRRAEVVDLIVRLRKELTDAGLDAGPDTIAWHLEPPPRRHRRPGRPSPGILARAGAGRPRSRRSDPKSSYIRFEAAMPNETWQSDFTHYRLDRRHRRRRGDHHLARRLLPLRPARHRPPPGHRTDRARHLPQTAGQHGIPASTLTDNGMVYTVRFAGGRGGRNSLRARATTPAHRPEELPTRTTPPPAGRSSDSSRR